MIRASVAVGVPARQLFSRVSALPQQHLSSEQERVVRLTVAGPPDAGPEPPRVVEVDDPLSAPAELVCAGDQLQLQAAGITKSEAREQAAVIQAQRDEIAALRAALADAQDAALAGAQAYRDAVVAKDGQLAQLYELAAGGVRERAKLRQEVSDVQAELAGAKRQLHAFMASLVALRGGLEGGERASGDVERAIELLRLGSAQSVLGVAAGTTASISSDEEVLLQLQQMQALSEALVADMREDEALKPPS